MSWTSAREYEIARPTRRCAATGRPLEPGEPVVTILLEPEPGEPLERRDYSQEGWSSAERPAGVIGLWRAPAPDESTPRRPAIDDEELTALFHDLAEATEPRRLAFRFILALHLMRRRIFRPAGQKRRGEETMMLVRDRGPEGWDEARPPIEVVDPNLDEETIEAVTDQLSEILDRAS